MAVGTDARGGFVHEAALYGSDEEFLAVAVPFLEAGVAAGEPALVALAGSTAGLLRSELGDAEGVVFLDDTDRDGLRPATFIETTRRFLAERVDAGARRVRAVGETPHPGLGVPWFEWARYEAALNHAFADLPLWRLCPFDTRTAPADVVADVLRTHPRLTTADGTVDNPRYQDPAEFLGRRSFVTADPPEPPGAPAAEVLDPRPEEARGVARAAGGLARLGDEDVDDLVLAVSEAVTNALEHGLPPVRLRVWTEPGRVVATVGDAGNGPRDPFAGLLPAVGSATGGFGLWAIHQVCSEVSHHRSGSGFALRLVRTRSAGEGAGA
jgi:anti-sigma regulatory factor (Ser/Thr protein kinase)